MKKISNDTAKSLSAIHGLAFVVFFIIEQVFEEFLYPFLSSNVSKPVFILITAVIGASLYTILFFIVRFIYDFILKIKDERLSIEGLWYIVHIPHYMGKEDFTQNRLSVGTATVTRDLLDFTIMGNNQRCYMNDDGSLLIKNENSTHWYTKATKLSDENDFDIIQIYEAKTQGNPTISVDACPCCKTKFETPIEITEAERFRHGIHKLDIIHRGKKFFMQGEYSDCWPSLKTGAIFFFRTEQERNDKIYEFFNEAKIWKNNNAK